MRHLYGLGAALMVAAMLEPPFRLQRREEPFQTTPKTRAPSGPVIDTTRKTKREKRRRLAALSTPTSQP